ncbi:MAG: hypothetical protein O2794_00760 [bacterium]|nr:hypothetical protein [bacterium]
MILVTHAVVGAAFGHRLSSAAIAFVIGIISHYVFDMIPHWHYKPTKIREATKDKPFGVKTLTLGREHIPELAAIGLDLTAGLILSFIFFDGAPLVILASVIGAVLPDLVVGFTKIYPLKPLVWHDRFHRWMHSDIDLDEKHIIGIGSQTAIIILFILLAA